MESAKLVIGVALCLFAGAVLAICLEQDMPPVHNLAERLRERRYQHQVSYAEQILAKGGSASE